VSTAADMPDRRAVDATAMVDRLRATGIALPFAALFITLSIASSSFLTKVNLLNILDQQSATLIIAAAGTLVLVAGGIDLSVGAVYSLAGVTAAEMAQRTSPVVAIVLGVSVGLAVGLVNGLVVTRLRINALIATLAMSFVVAGLGTLVTHGNLVVLFEHPEFGDLARTQIFTVKSSIWIALIAVVVIGVLLARTTAGRYMYASGGNAEAARLAGVRVDATRAQAASGDTLAFTVLAGIVVGGTSILGGEGAVWRTFLGVLFIALIGNGYDLLGLDPLYEQITLGVILLAAVAIDAWARARPNR
jgi:ribose transport system permease protein